MNYFDDLNDMSCEYPSYRPFTSAALASSTEKIAAIADTADISDADYCSDDTGYTWLCRIEDRFCDAHRHLPLFNEAQRRSRDHYADALHKTAESAKLLLLYSKLTKTEAETITRVAARRMLRLAADWRIKHRELSDRAVRTREHTAGKP